VLGKLATNFLVLINLQPNIADFGGKSPKVANSSQSPGVKFDAESSQNSPITREIWPENHQKTKTLKTVEYYLMVVLTKFLTIFQPNLA